MLREHACIQLTSQEFVFQQLKPSKGLMLKYLTFKLPNNLIDRLLLPTFYNKCAKYSISENSHLNTFKVLLIIKKTRKFHKKLRYLDNQKSQGS